METKADEEGTMSEEEEERRRLPSTLTDELTVTLAEEFTSRLPLITAFEKFTAAPKILP